MSMNEPIEVDRSHAFLWIFFYFAANLMLTLHNKWVLSKLHFAFPWTLTAIHIGVSGVGSYFILRLYYGITPQKIGKEAQLKLFLFSLLYAINIALSNVSLAYVSLAFHQLVRSATPAFTVIMELVLFQKIQSRRIYISLIPVIVGICFATIDEFEDISFTMTGLILTVLGVLLSCLKGIVTNVLMVGPLKLHPLEVIYRMSLPSVLQCLLYGTIFGEIQKIPSFFLESDHNNTFNYDAMIKLLFNGSLAMFLNWVSFTANKKTSALTMTVAANVKQALSILLAIYIFNSRISILNMFGISIALLGGAWYSWEVFKEKEMEEMRRKDKEYQLVTC